ncbi:MAG: AbrB/MazE/SpoVT family DNA-binding domain-containing protein [Alphaproteobacteria bacterium]|nr:AbrB/MazE/SpoVT family DNA-binding domain-containing protein [Rhizobiaceae bacterium]MBU3961348.1 AbrB/MazE/SpoVT family DNA-binding domain-containing protein [Alphaproteobacteria bacterium]MBU4052230.1 AbrB/MazE/SpoVT family DNA-binding domain-containing protein [Alphaproteobacteria bacterium]MBU4087516.1 AbrB/MazE/SpoVT family DNA-binding domain-containing protein [Alphaproteobacteria bacterium]MBU4157691.1 AbrB/MazE/SpoVT family DNA-binding domain-containing protein [Alphaproteobacteria b
MKVWEVTLSPKGQVTIPKEMRDILGLRPGDQVIYSVIDGEIVVTPKNIDLKDLAGLLGAPPNGPATLEEIDKAVAEAAGASVLSTAGDEKSDVAA